MNIHYVAVGRVSGSRLPKFVLFLLAKKKAPTLPATKLYSDIEHSLCNRFFIPGMSIFNIYLQRCNANSVSSIKKRNNNTHKRETLKKNQKIIIKIGKIVTIAPT